MRIIKNAIQKIPWIKESDMDVDKRILEYLKEHNQEYIDLGKEVDKILDDYPILSQLLDKENAITLTEEQHKSIPKIYFPEGRYGKFGAEWKIPYGTGRHDTLHDCDESNGKEAGKR